MVLVSDFEKLSLEALDNEAKSRAFALVILRYVRSKLPLMRAARAGSKAKIRLGINSGNSGFSKCDAPGVEHRAERCAAAAQ
ncbi:hypothetical protein CCU68_14395 [Pseudomonas gingeri NCPPB 3146 = LMG 5327]|uniref:Uncharacterized protein n=1 Tax=Pseudomonas gingeri NCPPB 3146 = LMG 5327 TaxID=707248 RepID=A0ABX4Y4D4_9PSED|nr:hypothetical protein CCU68_14395 [Pseudomonas gingeri NCPPB 3146 = LMG 5327]